MKELFLIFLVIVLFFNLYIKENMNNIKMNNIKMNNKINNNKRAEPCDDKISDLDYLYHMIPHHQVAVDISVLHINKTKWPKMKEILRKLIWTQKYEIALMKEMLNKLIVNISNDKKMNTNYISTVSDFIKPNKLGLTGTYCDPHFFDPEKHMEHLQHMKLDDNMYIEHMIPHHQVAVDMSKKLLKHTKNDFMIYLSYRIIRSQQEEIILLNDLLKTKKEYRYQSILL